MCKKVSDLFAGPRATAISGVFLALSLILLLTRAEFPVDPAWVTVVLSGYPLLYLALIRLVCQRWISSALLISIAMIASIIIGELFAAGEVAFIMAVGAILEDKTVERAKKGLNSLISLTPVQGRKIVTGPSGILEEMIAADEIRHGDMLRILPGEAIPADGEIVSGNTSVDQSIMTGESLPVDKKAGDSVFCGTINQFGAIDIVATGAGEDSSLQKLIRVVQNAEHNKAPMQRLADRWATWLVPIALAIAAATLVVTGELIRAVTILVVFCPCALVLATPTSIMAAIGQATKHGVIIKSGEALERMGRVDCIAFDKTGSLTNGALVVSDIHPLTADMDRDSLLALAASAEGYSEHPLAKAIVHHAKENGIPLQAMDDFQMIPGKGIRATVNGQILLCGNPAYLRENGIPVDGPIDAILARFQSQGKAVVLIARDTALTGAIALSDTLRDAAKHMVGELHGMRINVILLTGDHEQTAGYFAGQVGIRTVKAQLLPADKVRGIEALMEQGHKVCMIGDGVNDAPALKTANVGVAMGGMGSDIAVEAADIALIGDDIAKIPYLKRLANSTVSTIKFNIMLSMAINLVAILLSAAGVLTPVSGALVHNIGSVLVVLNAALLYDRKLG